MALRDVTPVRGLPSGGAAGQVLRVRSGDTTPSWRDDVVINVLDYGAVGDGTADDTSAINEALDAAGAASGTFFLPTGRYKITDTLIWPNGVEIEAGYGRVTGAANFPPVLMWYGPDGGTIIEREAIGGGFGNDTSLAGISLSGTNGGNRAGIGIHFQSRCDRGRGIHGVRVGGCDVGLQFDFGGINQVLRNSSVDTCEVAGIVWNLGGPDDLYIEASTLDNHRADGVSSAPGLVLDSTVNAAADSINLSLLGVRIEVNGDLDSDEAAIIFRGKNTTNRVQLLMSAVGLTVTRGSGVTRNTGLLVTPASDAVDINLVRCSLDIEGVPSIGQRITPSSQLHGLTMIAPFTATQTLIPTDQRRGSNILADLNAQHYYRYGKRAAVVLHGTTADSALSGVSMYPGDLLIDPATVASGHRVYREVSVQGTLGTLAGVTADGTAGATTITVNDASALRLDQSISVGGEAKSIKWIWENTVTLNTALAGNHTGSAVTWRSPTFREFPGAPLRGSATWNPPSIADGDSATTTVTVTGAALGDFAQASFSLDLQGVTLTASVSAANTVMVVLTNTTGAPIDLGSGTVKVRVTSV